MESVVLRPDFLVYAIFFLLEGVKRGTLIGNYGEIQVFIIVYFDRVKSIAVNTECML